MQSTTGKRGVFGSRIAFAMSGRGSHEIGSVDMDGGRMAVLTKMGSDSLLPAYSPGGAEIAFTSYARNNPDLWIVVGGRRARAARVEAAGPEHGRVLVARRTFHRADAVARGKLRDLSDQPGRRPHPGAPHPEPGDRQLALVLARRIADRVRLQPAGLAADLRDVVVSGGGAKRVTFQGKYNQTPRFCPRTDKPQLAFTGRDEKGVFDVFILDLKTSQIDRIVPQAKGSNLDPTWSPDGRLLAYTSTRGGLFVYNPETHHEVQVWKGAASSPSWGPAPRR